MYIDFRDPEKNSYSSNSKRVEISNSEPVKTRGFDKFRRKKREKDTKEDKPIIKEVSSPPESIKTEKSNLKNSENSSLDILQKINQVIAEQNGTSINTQESRINTTHTKQEESANLSLKVDSKEDRIISDNSTDANYTPPSVPKIGRGGFQAFEFRGNAKEYFKIWIVNVALSILTLGIYSAWAKVRTNRYLYGNTYLNNSNFEYNADPKRILIGRVIIVLFYALFLIFGKYLNMHMVAIGILIGFLLLLPWLIRQAISFKLKSASYRNIPFKFHAKVRSFYLIAGLAIFAVIVIIVAVVLLGQINPIFAGIAGIIGYFLISYLVAPRVYRRYKSVVINNSTYGNANFFFTATRGDAIKMFFKISFLTFIAGVIFFALVGAAIGMGGPLLHYIPASITQHPLFKYVTMGFSMMLYLVFTGLYKGITDGYLSNFTREHTTLETAAFKSRIKPLKLGFISATNMLMLLFSIGLLYPYTKLRYLRYKIENTYFEGSNYDNIASQGYEDTNAIGEEAMDFFDIDIGI